MVSLIVAIVALNASGCARLRLPAIDPSGERVFLPAPNYTTVNRHHERDPNQLQKRCVPQPVFKVPDAPECELPPVLPNSQPAGEVACIDENDRAAPRILVPSGCQQSRGDVYSACNSREEVDNQSTVTLTPRRKVAAVGTEVALIAGVCDANGFYRTREDLEWAITQGSVGHFVEPGEAAVGWFRRRGRLASFGRQPLPTLLSNNYALTRSSSKVQVLTQGTAKPSDDQFVLQGQSWISVTSAKEGDTFVTVMAPNIDGWQQRQEMAVVHWVDGQWTLPESVASDTVQPVTLNASVRRKLTTAPVAGWIVRYVIDPASPATFDGGSREVEVVTDVMGNASARVVPTSSDGGIAQITVQIIRPAGIGGSADRLIVGQGTTTVTWSSASLDIQITGPETVQFNESAVYRIQVTNPSRLVANDALVRATIPAGFEYVTSAPAATTFGSRLDWNLGPVGPGEQRILEVTYRATQSGVARHCATVQMTGAPAVESCITSVVVADALYIEMVGPNPEVPLLVGQTIQYQVTVTNRGDRRLEDVILVDRFDPGLIHEQGESPVERPIGALDPGQSQRIGLTFQVGSPGRHCHTLEASASGTRPASARACIVAQLPAQANVTVQKTGPTQATVGQRIDFYTIVTNTGEAPLTNLQVIDSYDPEFRPVDTNPADATIDGERVIWYVTQLDPGEKRTFQVTCEALFDVDRACSRVLVRTADGLERSGESCLPILPQADGTGALDQQPTDTDLISAPSPPGSNDLFNTNASDNDTTTPPSESDGLGISIDGRGERWSVGDEIEYLVVIQNNRDVHDSNVVLTVKLPAQVSLKGYRGRVSANTHSPDWRVMQMRPIKTLRAGETVQFTILVKVDEPGEFAARVELSSLRSPDVVADEAQALATQ